jgi:hypothetical protein
LGVDILDAEIVNKMAKNTSGVLTKKLNVSLDKLLNEEQLALVLISPILAPCN